MYVCVLHLNKLPRFLVIQAFGYSQRLHFKVYELLHMVLKDF